MQLAEFTKPALLALNAAARQSACERLSRALGERIKSTASGRPFHDVCHALVRELRDLGHDLWSFDESDDFLAWCPNYQKPTGPGIVVTFRDSGVVEVEWTGDQADDAV